MINLIEFVQLNHGWNADPVFPDIQIGITGNNLTLSFYMNAYEFENYDEGDTGILTFYNFFQYRVGPPNDEGFYNFNQSRYKKYGVNWGEFYLVKNSDWQTNFPDPIKVNPDADIDIYNINHYLFYMKDETFECIAENWRFDVNKI